MRVSRSLEKQAKQQVKYVDRGETAEVGKAALPDP